MKNNCIGTNEKELERTKNLYSLLCSDLSVCLFQLEDVFPGITPDDLLDFIRGFDPEKWLQKRFAEAKQDEHPGLNVLKMIQAGIIPLPYEITESINDHAKIRELISQIKGTQFHFPLARLFDKKEKAFQLNQEFEQAAFNHYSTFAETPEQQTIVENINQIATSLNTLAGFGIFNFGTNGVLMLGKLGEFFDVEKSSNKPLKASRRLFWRPILRRFNSQRFKNPLPFETLFDQSAFSPKEKV